jgi:hypothetical protein
VRRSRRRARRSAWRAAQPLRGEPAVVVGEAALDRGDLRLGQAVAEPAQLLARPAQLLADALAEGIVAPGHVLERRAALQARGRLPGEPRIVGQRLGAMPAVEGGDARLEGPGLLPLEVDVARRLPAQPDVGMVVGELELAAAGGQREQRRRREPRDHQ